MCKQCDRNFVCLDWDVFGVCGIIFALELVSDA
jgi:hypothetical protein